MPSWSCSLDSNKNNTDASLGCGASQAQEWALTASRGWICSCSGQKPPDPERMPSQPEAPPALLSCSSSCGTLRFFLFTQCLGLGRGKEQGRLHPCLLPGILGEGLPPWLAAPEPPLCAHPLAVGVSSGQATRPRAPAPACSRPVSTLACQRAFSTLAAGSLFQATVRPPASCTWRPLGRRSPRGLDPGCLSGLAPTRLLPHWAPATRRNSLRKHGHAVLPLALTPSPDTYLPCSLPWTVHSCVPDPSCAW